MWNYSNLEKHIWYNSWTTFLKFQTFECVFKLRTACLYFSCLPPHHLLLSALFLYGTVNILDTSVGLFCEELHWVYVHMYLHGSVHACVILTHGVSCVSVLYLTLSLSSPLPVFTASHNILFPSMAVFRADKGMVGSGGGDVMSSSCQLGIKSCFWPRRRAERKWLTPVHSNAHWCSDTNS